MRGGGAALRKLEEAADALLAEAAELPNEWGPVLEFLTGMGKQLNRCELAFAQGAGIASELYLEDLHDGDLTPIQTLRYDCKMATGAASAAVAVGEQLAALPQSTAALDEGRIGFAHLTLLARTAEFCGEGFQERPLLKRAQRNDVSAFAKTCARARYQYCPDKFVQDERSLFEERFLELSTRAEDGAVFLRGFLDADGGAHLRTAIDALSQPLPNDDRVVKQRQADALVEISRAALDSGQVPSQGDVRPHVQVTATLETLLGLPGAPPAELEGSGPISAGVPAPTRAGAARLAGDCSLRRLLRG